MKLTLLGTGNAMATRCYNTCFALRSGAACFLVDAGGGNGVLRQLELAQLPTESIEGMFITHAFCDHARSFAAATAAARSIFFSYSAFPRMAPYSPSPVSARTSERVVTPPEATSASCGKREARRS